MSNQRLANTGSKVNEGQGRGVPLCPDESSVNSPDSEGGLLRGPSKPLELCLGSRALSESASLHASNTPNCHADLGEDSVDLPMLLDGVDHDLPTCPLCGDPVFTCSLCGEPVRWFADVDGDAEGLGVVFDGELYCMACLLALAREMENVPHPLTLKRLKTL